MQERFSIRRGHSADLFGPKSFFVEFNGFTGPFHDQVWCQCVKTAGNWFDSAAHVFSFLSLGLLIGLCHFTSYRRTGNGDQDIYFRTLPLWSRTLPFSVKSERQRLRVLRDGPHLDASK